MDHSLVTVEAQPPKRVADYFEVAVESIDGRFTLRVYAAAVGFAPGIVPAKAAAALPDWLDNDQNEDLVAHMRARLRR